MTAAESDTHVCKNAEDLAHAKKVALADVVGHRQASTARDVGTEKPVELERGAFSNRIQALSPRRRGREGVRAGRGSPGEDGVAGGVRARPAGHAGVGSRKALWSGGRRDGLEKIGDMEGQREAGRRDMRY